MAAVKDSFNDEGGKAGSNLPARPNILAILGDIIYRRRQDHRCRMPSMMPGDTGKAVQWFMKTMEPMRPDEQMRLKDTVKEKTTVKKYWSSPYLDRIQYLLIKFFELKPQDQEIIVGYCENKIYWRGEAIDHFFKIKQSVFAETLLMREIGLTDYKARAKEKMKHYMMGASLPVESSNTEIDQSVSVDSEPPAPLTEGASPDDTDLSDVDIEL